MSIDRQDPPTAGSEAATLIGFLEFLRGTIELKTEGLNADQLGTSLPPSTMTLGGMLKHLAFVEDWWFTAVFRGEPPTPPFDRVDWDADPDWDWHSAAADTPDQLRSLWRDMVDRSRDITATAIAEPAGLDALSVTAHTSNEFSLRWILVHMIEEYGRHAGHADLIRESIDGHVGE